MVGLLKVRSATLLMATIVVAGGALGLSADGSVAAAKRPAGAVKLTGASQKSRGAVRCGKLKGSWLPGTKLAGGYFITHTKQAANFRKLASRSKAKTRAKHLRSDAKFRGKARAELAICRTDSPIGDTGPGGGKIFYAPGGKFTMTGAACGSSCRYLEAAPVGWNSGGSPDPFLQWGGGNGTAGQCSNKDIPGATGTGIGSGFANTAAIMAACPSADPSNAQSAPAARAAACYQVAGTCGLGNYGQWFLPSFDELALLDDISSVVGLTPCLYYWSSSQANASYAESIMAGFTDGGGCAFWNAAKDNTIRVRAVRAF